MTGNKLNDRLKFHWFTWIVLPVFVGVLSGTSLWQYVQLRDIRAALDKADSAPHERFSLSESDWAPVRDGLIMLAQHSQTRGISEETFAALARGYVQGFEHNRAQDLRVQKMTIDENTNPAAPYLVVKYRRVSVAHPEGQDVTGYVVWGIDPDGTLMVNHYACKPCGA
ncbi:hypothetical protein [Candidatus Pantoea formicae]|uniref:hypothetical protein n=1 Tax=Candidatus Pantoea formicae TaxID=2608355 RepID=UPI003ED878A4